MQGQTRWKWGVIFGGDNLTMADQLRYAKMAEDAGAESVWQAEVWRDAFVPVAAMASVVQRARLGTAVAQFARPPMHTEMSAMSLAEVTGGRFVLGVGTGPPQWNADWHGLELHRPVARMREYIDCIRTMWTGSPTHPVAFTGEFFNVQRYARFMAAPALPPPIYLAAVNRRMLQLAGSHAQGWISGPLNTLKYMTSVVQPNLQKGLAAAGRSSSGFERCLLRLCVVHRDAKYARRVARNGVAVYATLPYYDIVLNPMGFAGPVQAIRAASQRGDLPGMLDAVTEDMIDALVFAGTPDDVRRQLAPWEGLIDLLMLGWPPSLLMEPVETRAMHEAVIATFST